MWRAASYPNPYYLVYSNPDAHSNRNCIPANDFANKDAHSNRNCIPANDVRWWYSIDNRF
jgi:hypothetical protein